MRGRTPGALRRHQECRAGARGARQASGEGVEAWQWLRVSFPRFIVHPDARILALESVATADMGAPGRRRATPLPAAGRAESCDGGAGAVVEVTDTAGRPVEAAPSRRSRARPSRRGVEGCRVEAGRSRRRHARGAGRLVLPGRSRHAPGAVEALSRGRGRQGAPLDPARTVERAPGGRGSCAVPDGWSRVHAPGEQGWRPRSCASGPLPAPISPTR